MIKKFIDKFLGRGERPAKSTSVLGKRVEIAAAEHGINPQLLDDRAVRRIEFARAR